MGVSFKPEMSLEEIAGLYFDEKWKKNYDWLGPLGPLPPGIMEKIRLNYVWDALQSEAACQELKDWWEFKTWLEDEEDE